MNYDGPSYYKQKKIKRSTKDSAHPDQLSNKQVQAKSEYGNYQVPPPNYLEKQDFKNKESNQIKSRYFRNKYIPQSLQNLEGWKKTEKNQKLLFELENRLVKTDEDYLLFSFDTDEDIKQKNVNNDSKKLSTQQTDVKQTKRTKEATIAEAHEQLKKELQKPARGLHRSLSKIMAEDEEAMKKGKNNLGSLFT